MMKFHFVGDIVYMGPVTLNKDTLVNKAGMEVNVIPIMKSPCPSPTPKRSKRSKRARSEMGFRKDKIEEDRGSLPDLYSKSSNIPIKGSLVDTIIQMDPQMFLSRSLETGSTDSIISSYRDSDKIMTRSLGSTDSLSKGVIVNAVVNWLQKTSPFSSVENIMNQSWSTSIPDINASHADDELDVSILSESEISTNKSHLKDDKHVPNILISEDEDNFILLPSEFTLTEEEFGRNSSSFNYSTLGK